MKKDEALKLALKELEAWQRFTHGKDEQTKKAINAIKEALAQHDSVQAKPEPKQEPVAWMMPDGKTVDKWGLKFYAGLVGTPLYTAPPQRKPLTDEQILSIARDHYNPHQRPEISFARAIEAAHGIKEQL